MNSTASAKTTYNKLTGRAELCAGDFDNGTFICRCREWPGSLYLSQNFVGVTTCKHSRTIWRVHTTLSGWKCQRFRYHSLASIMKCGLCGMNKANAILRTIQLKTKSSRIRRANGELGHIFDISPRGQGHVLAYDSHVWKAFGERSAAK